MTKKDVTVANRLAANADEKAQKPKPQRSVVTRSDPEGIAKELKAENQRLHDYINTVHAAREKVREKQAATDKTKEKYQEAKEALDAANLELANVIDEEVPEPTLLDGIEPANAWREVGLNALDLDDKDRKALIAAIDPPTFGALHDAVSKRGQLEKVKGLEDGQAFRIRAALAKWYREKPQQSPPVNARIDIHDAPPADPADKTTRAQPPAESALWRSFPVKNMDIALISKPILEENNLNTAGAIRDWVRNGNNLAALPGMNKVIADEVLIEVANLEAEYNASNPKAKAS